MNQYFQVFLPWTTPKPGHDNELISRIQSGNRGGFFTLWILKLSIGNAVYNMSWTDHNKSVLGDRLPSGSDYEASNTNQGVPHQTRVGPDVKSF